MPEAWREEVAGEHVEVLPLVDEPALNQAPGWCTYLYPHPDAPEVEFLCGGINGKTPKAAGLWRQGNLLHFGFEQSPAELNETGRALLINSISYIARFTEDEPIGHVPSPFTGPAASDRDVIPRALARPSRGMVYLKYVLADSTYNELEKRDDDERQAWYERFRGYLHGDENGKLAVDEVALAHGAGAGMDSLFMRWFASGLAQRGFRVARFEFPYMAERRETGKKRPPDREPVLLETWREVTDSFRRKRLQAAPGLRPDRAGQLERGD